MDICRVMTSYTLRICGGMAPMAAVLEWKDIGSLGRTGMGAEGGT